MRMQPGEEEEKREKRRMEREEVCCIAGTVNSLGRVGRLELEGSVTATGWVGAARL